MPLARSLAGRCRRVHRSSIFNGYDGFRQNWRDMIGRYALALEYASHREKVTFIVFKNHCTRRHFYWRAAIERNANDAISDVGRWQRYEEKRECYEGQ